MTGGAKTLADFAIGNQVTDLDRHRLLNIGTGPTDVQRRLFQRTIRSRYESADRPRVHAEMAAVDPADAKTYEGGCRCQKFWNCSAARPDDWPSQSSLVGTCHMSSRTSPSLPCCVAMKSVRLTMSFFVFAEPSWKSE